MPLNFSAKFAKVSIVSFRRVVPRFLLWTRNLDLSADHFDNEFHQVYIAELKVNLSDLKPQEEEVEALKLVTFDEFETLLSQSETNNHFIPTNKSYYSFILDAIKAQLEL